MATENDAYRLTDKQQELLDSWSARTGRSVADLIAEAIDSIAPRIGENGHGTSTLAERLSRAGLMGCLSGGPADLSTNPDHFKGFGQ